MSMIGLQILSKDEPCFCVALPDDINYSFIGRADMLALDKKGVVIGECMESMYLLPNGKAYVFGTPMDGATNYLMKIYYIRWETKSVEWRDKDGKTGNIQIIDLQL